MSQGDSRTPAQTPVELNVVSEPAKGQSASARLDSGVGPARPIWDPTAVKARLEEAAETLKAMTLNGRDRPARLKSGWPDVVHKSVEAYGYSAVRVRPPAPSPACISRADEAVTWLLWLTDSQRRVTWARASGITWRRLEDIDGRSHVTLRRIQSAALECICSHLMMRADDLAVTPRGDRKADPKINLT